MKLDIHDETKMPSGVTVGYKDGILTITGPKGEVSRPLRDPRLAISASGDTLLIACKNASRREKRMAKTFNAHVKNMIAGVQEPYRYKLKICSGHFPMNVTVQGDQFVVKNFLGEKFPRVLKLKKGAVVKVEGEFITVESCDKDLAGCIASDIELLTVKRNRDLRVFQDGIYMIEKANQKLEAS